MSKHRVEAFTDGVIAIIITIMVLELQAPAGGNFADLWALRYRFLIYFVSFLTMAVYWNNHHHLFQVVSHVDGLVLWSNIAFLFASSLFPFATAWVGAHHLTSFAPEMFYGGVVLLADLAYYALVQCLLRVNTRSNAVQKVLGKGYYKPLIHDHRQCDRLARRFVVGAVDHYFRYVVVTAVGDPRKADRAAFAKSVKENRDADSWHYRIRTCWGDHGIHHGDQRLGRHLDFDRSRR
jgi:uncharacterized membrane protein